MVDIIALGVFLIEMMIKILAQGKYPWRYFVGLGFKRCKKNRGEIETKVIERELTEKEADCEGSRYWNNFDFMIIAICVLQDISGGGGSMKSMRILRLLRVLRLVRAWKELRVISTGLVSGLAASAAIMGLYLFITYLYGMIGVSLFALNDPFHFHNLESAFYTLYIVTNMEWLDMTFTSYYGCNNPKSGSAYVVFLNDSHALYPDLAGELATLSNYYDGYKFITQEKYENVSYRLNEEDGGWIRVVDAEDPMLPKEMWCTPNKTVVMGSIYFSTYIIVSGLIMVTLFTGAVSVSMTNAIMEMKNKPKKSPEELAADPAHQAGLRMTAMWDTCMSCCYSTMGCTEAGPRNEDNKLMAFRCDTHRRRMLLGLMSAERKEIAIGQQFFSWARTSAKPNGPTPESVLYQLHLDRHLNTFLLPGRGSTLGEICGLQVSLWTKCKMLHAELSMCARDLSHNYLFKMMVNSTIIFAALEGGFEAQHPGMDCTAVSDIFLLVMRVVFTIEFAVKVWAEGAHPFCYFYQGWNIFDFLIWIVTILPAEMVNSTLSSVRALRMLKLIKGASGKSAPQLSSVLSAFTAAIVSFKYVGALWLLSIYLFAILGFNMFAQNDPKMFGTLHGAMFSLFGASSFDGVGDMMLTQVYGCDLFGSYIDLPFFDASYYFPEDDAGDDGGDGDDDGEDGDDDGGRRLLRRGLSKAVKMGTKYAGHMVSRVLRGKKKHHHAGGPSSGHPPCTSHASGFIAYIYFLVYTTFSALILLSILLGVIQGGMETAAEEQEAAAEKEEAIHQTIVKRPAAKPYVQILIDAFDRLDEDKDGHLSHTEIIRGLGGSGLSNGLTKKTEIEHFADILCSKDRTGGEEGDHEEEGCDLLNFCDYILSQNFDSVQDTKEKAGMTPTALSATDEAYTYPDRSVGSGGDQSRSLMSNLSNQPRAVAVNGSSFI
jgi:hypothetical protein